MKTAETAKEFLKNRGLKNPPLDSGISGGGDAPRRYASDLMEAYASQFTTNNVPVDKVVEGTCLCISSINDFFKDRTYCYSVREDGSYVVFKHYGFDIPSFKKHFKVVENASTPLSNNSLLDCLKEFLYGEIIERRPYSASKSFEVVLEEIERLHSLPTDKSNEGAEG